MGNKQCLCASSLPLFLINRLFFSRGRASALCPDMLHGPAAFLPGRGAQKDLPLGPGLSVAPSPHPRRCRTLWPSPARTPWAAPAPSAPALARPPPSELSPSARLCRHTAHLPPLPASASWLWPLRAAPARAEVTSSSFCLLVFTVRLTAQERMTQTGTSSNPAIARLPGPWPQVHQGRPRRPRRLLLDRPVAQV